MSQELPELLYIEGTYDEHGRLRENGFSRESRMLTGDKTPAFSLADNVVSPMKNRSKRTRPGAVYKRQETSGSIPRGDYRITVVNEPFRVEHRYDGKRSTVFTRQTGTIEEDILDEYQTSMRRTEGVVNEALRMQDGRRGMTTGGFFTPERVKITPTIGLWDANNKNLDISTDCAISWEYQEAAITRATRTIKNQLGYKS